MSEHELQCAVVKWWRLYMYTQYRPLLFAIPNGGLRNAVVARKLKAEGVLSGVPDLFCAMRRGGFAGFWLELKTEKGRLSAAQSGILKLLNEQGYLAQVSYGFYQAIDYLKDYVDGKAFHV